jgi:multiple sugar transport system substrate-binding protein
MRRHVVKMLLSCVIMGCILFPLMAGAKDVTLTYWAAPLGTEEMVNETWTDITQKFEEETGIKVEFEMVPWRDLATRLITAMTGGGGPDVTGMGNNMSIGFSATGGMLSLTPERMEKIGGRDKFYDRPFMVTGEQGIDSVSVPLTVVNNVMFYNKELFAEVGATQMPTKWEEFIEIGQKITKDTDGDGKPDRWGYGLIGKPIQCWKPFLVLAFQRGVEFLDDDGKLVYNSEAGVDAMRFLSEFISTYKITPPVAAEWDYDDTVTAFYQGEVAAIIGNSDTIALLNRTDIKGKFGVAPVPYIWPGKDDLFEGGSPASSHVGGTNIGILGTTEHEEEALKFVEFVTRPGINRMICEAFQSISPIKGAYKEGELNELQEASANIAQNHCTPMPLVPYFQPSLNITASAIQAVLAKAGEGPVPDEFIREQLDAALEEANTSLVR